MPTAEIITIGTEILLGEIVDTNARRLARKLRDLGIDLYRKTTVGDNADRIAEAIRLGLDRAEIILTTGGLGPTVDDPTRQAVAQALGVDLEFRPELWEQIRKRFRRFSRLPTENNRRQAYLPQGAIAVENPVGTAPAFIVEVGASALIALPGVPSEMEYLLENAISPYLRSRFNLTGMIKARVLHTSGVGESQIDERIGDLEILSNPTVGLAAHSGQVDVRITAKAASELEADTLIRGVEAEIRQRLGAWIYGADGDTLEQVALDTLAVNGWKLVVVESGLRGELVRRLANTSGAFARGEVIPQSLSGEDLSQRLHNYRIEHGTEVGLGVSLTSSDRRHDVILILITPTSEEQFIRPYGGPPEYAPRWAFHHSLDVLRQIE